MFDKDYLSNIVKQEKLASCTIQGRRKSRAVNELHSEVSELRSAGTLPDAPPPQQAGHCRSAALDAMLPSRLLPTLSTVISFSDGATSVAFSDGAAFSNAG
eukprot:CAMPEP_0177345656 /NCGR_PEP_ID=MMETSP0368-20130122/28763_1 /TAXON_ID=447022 ORGANISM="Scrippsiella hangoei-like, Strain SHHI-4" /NCGR_SAMPLE_ID=MMETSP0368 /ASSEMBLY_ACC=CAM_ASM_000363 /LENGTH=100 /DNA_ID=CAMNT_0018807245 /DNA_START=48 /DNA_END=348 /DNA_ORIENTATION=+